MNCNLFINLYSQEQEFPNEHKKLEQRLFNRTQTLYLRNCGFFIFLFFILHKIEFYSSLIQVYSVWNSLLKTWTPTLAPPYLTSTYTCGITIAPRVCGARNCGIRTITCGVGINWWGKIEYERSSSVEN